MAPAPEDGHAIGDVHHLLELVRDEDDPAALACHPAQALEELHRLLRSQDRGRLVEDEDVRSAIEVLQDLDALLLADGELPDGTTGVDAHAVVLGEACDVPLELPRPDQRPGRVPAERDVLGRGEPVDEAEVLVHHADAAVDRVSRRAQLRRRAPDRDRARVGMHEPGEHVHQRGLAGAVLAEERVDLPGAKVEVDVVVGQYARELLHDPAELDERRRRAHAPRRARFTPRV